MWTQPCSTDCSRHSRFLTSSFLRIADGRQQMHFSMHHFVGKDDVASEKPAAASALLTNFAHGD